MNHYYKIADLTVEMDTFGRTLEQAKPYAIPPVDKADVSIKCDWERFKEKHPELSEETCEYIFTASAFYKSLILFDGIMLHSSAVVVDGKAYLFTAPCGTGKSTHTQLWLKKFGDRAFILNDDKPALRLEDGKFYAYGTPWSGKHDISVNCRAELGGICILSRGEVNKIERIKGKDAIIGIYSQTLRIKDVAYFDKILSLIDKLIERVGVWRLECNMDLEAAEISYRAMSAKV
jgi:hypothetical protein